MKPVETCYHCGDDCTHSVVQYDHKAFCCDGCKTVYSILEENQLCDFYQLNVLAGTSPNVSGLGQRFEYLDEGEIASQLIDFQTDKLCKISLHLPSVHCSSCVWLLENLSKIHPGVIYTRLDFVNKTLDVQFDPQQLSLRKLVELLTTLGYEPHFSQAADEKNQKVDSLVWKMALVGFCMGNAMIYSFPEYFNLENEVLPFKTVFQYINLALSVPVFFYGASDYLKSGWLSLKQWLHDRHATLSVDLPVSIGILALFLRSVLSVLVYNEAGYFDSLAGLVFFLLVGKWLQQRTYQAISFSHQYHSFFPLAVKRINGGASKYINIKEIEKNDLIEIHHGEILPADSVLVSPEAHIDYSFVTGEAKIENKLMGQSVWAGGKVQGIAGVFQVQKPMRQSYLTSLWNHSSFDKEKPLGSTHLADQFAKHFTWVALVLSMGTFFFWYGQNPQRAFSAAVAVLMVACPCALTLSMPFSMNVVMSIFGKNKLFVKNQHVIQHLNEIDTIVFDKTGTLTDASKTQVVWQGEELTEAQKEMIDSACRQSMHPVSAAISQYLQSQKTKQVDYFFEIPGQGFEASVGGCFVRIGHAEFLEQTSSGTYVEIDKEVLGKFMLQASLRPQWKEILEILKSKYSLYLLSGDTPEARPTFEPYFEHQYYQKLPAEKREIIERLQAQNKKVLMIGDGLNDAGALQKADLGMALSHGASAFSPAADALLDASAFKNLHHFFDFAKSALGIVKLSFLLSVVYNALGLYWAMSGRLSPVLAAAFMPLSSLSVVLFSVGLTYLKSKRIPF